MNNQDILPTASLQSFPQLSQIPSQISDVLNGEKIVASFEDSTIKYIIIFASFLPALTILLSLPIRIASFYEVFMQFI